MGGSRRGDERRGLVVAHSSGFGEEAREGEGKAC